MAFKAAAFAAEHGFAVLDVACYVGFRCRAPHGTDKHDDPPDIVIRQAAAEGWHRCASNAALDGFEDRALAQPEESPIAYQSRSAFPFSAVDPVTGGARA